MFDCHAHLFVKSQIAGPLEDPFASAPDPLGWSEYRKHIAEILPGRSVSGLFLGLSHPNTDIAAANEFMVREVSHDANSRSLMLVHPKMDPEFIRQTVCEKGFVGLKCYHVWSAEIPTFNSTIGGFLPEEHVRIMHEEDMVIMLHIVRPRALADSSNQETLRYYAGKYPRARFILAHAARGFNPFHTIEGIAALRGFANIWFDTSAVTESGALEAILRSFGAARLLYGSDFPISHMRGRCVAIGDSFWWTTDQNTRFTSSRAEIVPTLVGLESLRSLKLACLNSHLNDAEVESVFYGNAAQLLQFDRGAA